MKKMPANDTICAIATPPGPGGIGIVRLSGPDSLSILKKIWAGKISPENFEPRKLYLGKVVIPPPLVGGGQEEGGMVDFVHPPLNPLPSREGKLSSNAKFRNFIDHTMAVHMPAPNTYTGDDVVEIQAHGSFHVLNKILEALISCGARVAGPGEFTRRAFLAGKMDLAEAEGVADLIGATSERAARIASEQVAGRLSKEIRSIADALLNLRAELEASMDFPEEEDVVVKIGNRKEDAKTCIGEILSDVNRLISTYKNGRIIRDGARVAIIGRPNAGKSSLFNRLVGTDRAIVHHEPGTTRDVVEEAISLEGIAFKLKDTAGLRAGAGEVETLGIDRARDEILSADIVIAVFDGSLEFGAEDGSILTNIDPTKTIFVINKADLEQKFDPKQIPPGKKPMRASAADGTGLDEIQNCLVKFVNAGRAEDDGVIITNARHKAALDEAARALIAAQTAVSSKIPIECVASHLVAAQDALSKITGEVTTDDVLDRIFEKFCIGK